MDANNMERADRRSLRVLLVDPSLFTAPYDAGLTQGLLAAGVQPRWATRPTRPGDRQEIAPELVDDFFYRQVDAMTGLPASLRALAKGLAHATGLVRLIFKVGHWRPDVVHVQWMVLPPLDALAFWLIQFRCRLVVTAHDTVPFNGSARSPLQRWGVEHVLRRADAVIVHTQAGRDRLLKQGVDPHKLRVIAHGPLNLPVLPRPDRPARDPRITFVLFGEIKPYKGLDLLVEAMAILPAEQRKACRLLVAGRPQMELGGVLARIEALGLSDTIELRAQRQSEQQMADLFADADCVVFPYRQIDASGVYYLVKPLGKWLIASRVGIFSEDLRDGVDGRMIEPESVPELVAALSEFITRRPVPAQATEDTTWAAIGMATRALYERCLEPPTQAPSNVVTTACSASSAAPSGAPSPVRQGAPRGD